MNKSVTTVPYWTNISSKYSLNGSNSYPPYVLVLLCWYLISSIVSVNSTSVHAWCFLVFNGVDNASYHLSTEFLPRYWICHVSSTNSSCHSVSIPLIFLRLQIRRDWAAGSVPPGLGELPNIGIQRICANSVVEQWPDPLTERVLFRGCSWRILRVGSEV